MKAVSHCDCDWSRRPEWCSPDEGSNAEVGDATRGSGELISGADQGTDMNNESADDVTWNEERTNRVARVRMRCGYEQSNQESQCGGSDGTIVADEVVRASSGR